MSIFTKIFGDPNKKVLASLQPIVDEINGLADTYSAFSTDALKTKTEEFRARLAAGETLDDILPDAFAAVREVSKRTIGQFHYDVQLKGGIVLHRGQIAEMRTGEGKTLTGTLPTYLHALTGRGVHVITVNDYLAKRDAVWMGQIFHALGLSVGIIQQQLTSYVYDPGYRVVQKVTSEGVTDQGTEEDKERDETGSFHVEMDYLRPCERKEAYAADITYGTNNEFGFDYLRDNMVYSAAERVQRDLAYAMIDEVDSILIDEARTPLIISAPAEESGNDYAKCAAIARQLKVAEHYVLDEKQRAVTLTDVGIARVEQLLGLENLYVEGGHRMVHHVDSALRAEVLYKRDKDYVVKDGEILIVDEFTGRLMVGRRYSEGLHQAIEAKEGVEVQRESQTLATITFQNYFRLYSVLAGMTGTAVTEAEEFGKIYKLEVVVIPPNKISQRVDLGDQIYRTELGKFQAVVREVKARHEKGQPVLIGTISIEKNEMLSHLLELEGIPHEILNAKNHEREGEIVAQAGRRGGVTLATNMAGRGVDILLGGNPVKPEEQADVRALGGLLVIGTERHESRRIDNQLRGRAGRQGDPGATQFYISAEDDLMRIFGSDRMKSLMTRLQVPDDMPIEHSLITKSLETAQKKVEGHNFDIRKHLLEYDDVLNRHRDVIYKKRREILDASESADGGIEKITELLDAMLVSEVESLIFQATEVTGEADIDLDAMRRALSALLQMENAEVEKFLKPIEAAGEKDIVTLRTELIEPIEQHAKNRLRSVIKRMGAPDVALRSLSQVMLRALDTLWIEHLEALNYLRTGIGLRGYGQRDPLVEYKRESYRLFQELLSYVQKDVVFAVMAIETAMRTMPGLMEREGIVLSGAAKTQTVAGSGIHEGEIVGGASETETVNGEKIGRNDVCPCGSGKKYKKCHGSR
jgi:preprotein translocase subunit SecA